MDPDTQQPVHPALRRQSVMSKNSTIHQIFRALFKKNMAQTEYNEIARNYNDGNTIPEI